MVFCDVAKLGPVGFAVVADFTAPWPEGQPGGRFKRLGTAVMVSSCVVAFAKTGTDFRSPRV